MTTSSVSLSNKIVMNKFQWMSRQLRHFNDAGSIINWANAMYLVKGLLIDPLPTRPVTDYQQPSSSPSPHLQYNHPVSTTINLQRYQADRSITPPTTICFQPSTTKSLTKSPSYNYDIVPAKPAPLTIFNHRQPTISPTNALVPSPKRRKIITPPSVTSHASATNIINRSTTSSQIVPSVIPTRTPPSTTTISKDPSLPEGWFLCYNKLNRRCYYWNKKTGASQWVKPV